MNLLNLYVWFQDRIARFPGRVRLTPVQGQQNVFDITREDDPIVEGTPINRENLLRILQEALNVPTERIGSIEHGLKRYPICTLYRAERGAGMGGAGEGGAGGGSIVTVPAAFENNSFNNVTVIAVTNYAPFTEIHRINHEMYSFIDPNQPDNLESLLLTLNLGAFIRIDDAARRVMISGGGEGGDIEDI